MWTLIFFHILGLSLCQVAEAGSGNSTQMYYAKLKVDKSVIGNISEILKPFVNDARLHVDDLKMTTKCKPGSAGETCSCTPGHRWSDLVCRSQACCGDTECTFHNNSAQTCVLNGIVDITGSLILEGAKYQGCLTDETSQDYQDCKNDLLIQMKTVFSTLRGFDTLTITAFRLGSIIADFKTTIVSEVQSQELLERAEQLSAPLSASLTMVTTGIVHLSMPANPVCSNADTSLTCTSREDLKTQPHWHLENMDGEFDITNGTISTIIPKGPKESTITLSHISDHWAGEYTCVYLQRSGPNSIAHRANATMDVSVLPDIEVYTEPGFPRCIKSSDVLHVRAKCVIRKSSEPYNVTWEGDSISKISSSSSEHEEAFMADKVVNCNQSTDTSKLLCTFTNRCNQQRSASVSISIIYVGDKFCAAEGDWGDTKAGSTATLRCKDAAGLRQRKCDPEGRWEEEESECVNLELHSVLQRATIADTGLGALDKNAAVVFSRLNVVTNNTETIMSYANVNASVNVLSMLGEKVKSIRETSAAEDVLDSSSNLLEQSLDNVWKTTPTKESNFSLAERYLSTVEQLIEKASIMNGSRKSNVELQTCNDTEECKNSVFNVTVLLKRSGSGRVKTAGFKRLESYLPNNESGYTPNSIVVSTTTERKKSQLEITIDFPLLRQRPPNVEILCMSWNFSSRRWSSDGCRWAGASNEGRCICNHLSSFAILMSKYATNLPWMTEITYVGLSVSVASLILCLVVEMLVWSHVVKTNTSFLRHTAHVNIALCLLVADCCFLACSQPNEITVIWIRTFVVLKHFCYLCVFFWMLSLSSTLLHQTLFLFHQVSKKVYLRFSLVLGYVCPLLIVFITVLTNDAGAEGLYFSKETCWLVYSGLLRGSIHSFIIPIGIIVFVNVFFMVLVMMKLLERQNNVEKERAAAKIVIRSLIVLTPVFGVTWIFGFAMMLMDLTSGPMAFAVNYIFTLLNTFQGLFILLTTCLADKMTRDALLQRFEKKPPPSISNSSTKLELK